MNSSFVLFGNPIEHSKSSEIYMLFANEFGIPNKYDLRLVEKETFYTVFYNFFYNEGGIGSNITVPFKEYVVSLCDSLTSRAVISNAVNTIKKQVRENSNHVILLGDNTDGIGFISDLKRLNWVHKNNTIDNLYNSTSEFINILLIGSGGAAKGILPVLLDIKKSYIYIVNRTFLKAQKLADYYHNIGRENIFCLSMDELFYNSDKKKYSLIINATSSSMYNDVPNIPSNLINKFVKCYDLFYQKKDTSFIQWCRHYGANYYSDGLGMLIQQAAHSFYLWHNIFPSIDPVINYFR